MKGTWVTALTNTLFCDLPCALTDPWVQDSHPTPVSPKAQGNPLLFGRGSSVPYFVGRAGTGNLLQKTEGHLHEMSAKPPDVWYGLASTSGFLTEFLVFAPRCPGELQRTWQSRARPTEQRGCDTLVSCRGEAPSDFPPSCSPADPERQTCSWPFLHLSWITSGRCPAPSLGSSGGGLEWVMDRGQRSREGVRWWFGVPYAPGVEIGLKKQWSQFWLYENFRIISLYTSFP